MTQCKANDCDRSADRSANGRAGYCSMHYQRVKKFGDPSVIKSVPRPALDWIESHKNHDGNECLSWPFHVGKDGYGRIHDPDKGNKLTTASRYMLTQTQGEPPSDRHECAHSCGMGHKGCVNPQHLYWATPAENQADRVKHKTSNRGERQWKSKLTADDVLAIRNLSSSKSAREISEMFHVSPGAIYSILKRENWAWLNPKS